MSDYKERVLRVQARIEDAAKRSGRSANDVTLVAVSKTKPITAIRDVYEAGVRHFGENRAEEMNEKYGDLSELSDLHWHFIGRLQTRQSLPIAQHASLFHAVDRIKIAQRLSSQLESIERTLPIFIQVNVSGEESKAGFECSEWEENGEQRDALVQSVETIRQLPYLEIRGLMTMAPWDIDETTAHTVFRRVRELSEWTQKTIPGVQWPDLSMGMSGDFEIAVEEGSTCVRVGSAIFGGR